MIARVEASPGGLLELQRDILNVFLDTFHTAEAESVQAFITQSIRHQYARGGH